MFAFLLFFFGCPTDPTTGMENTNVQNTEIQQGQNGPQNGTGNGPANGPQNGGVTPQGNGPQGNAPQGNGDVQANQAAVGGGTENGPVNGPSSPENGPSTPPENGENIGDPNIPPDTIDQEGGQFIGENGMAPNHNGAPAPGDNGGTAPESGGPADGPMGGQMEPTKRPPTFIYNAHSEDSGPLYKAADGSCFVRKNWDQPPNGQLGETEPRDCPQQMASEAWANCVAGRLVKHNSGDREGTCECQPIEGDPKVVDCP